MSDQQSKTPKVTLEFQGVPKSHMLTVWDQLKQGIIPEGEDYILARSMADHKHWYAIFETIGIFDTQDQSEGVDPYLHIQLHRMIGLQILNQKPKQAFSFYQTRIKRKEEPHEVIHMMIHTFQNHMVNLVQQVMQDEEFQALHTKQDQASDQTFNIQLDHQHYAQQLKSMQNMSRLQIWNRLGFEEIPPLHPEQHQQFF